MAKKVKPYITSNLNDPRIQSYQDSLKLYNNYQELKNKLQKANYQKIDNMDTIGKLSDQEIIDMVNGNLSSFQKWQNKAKKLKPSKEGNLYKTLDFYYPLVNEDLGHQYFSSSIKPISEENWRRKRYSGDARLVKNYSNVNPKQQVIYKLDPPQNKNTNKTPINTNRTSINMNKLPYIKPNLSNSINTNILSKEDISKYKDLRMRSLWANSAKLNPDYKIGTFNRLDYNDESKGFTLQEALKFPKEIRDKYNIDMIGNKVFNNGGSIKFVKPLQRKFHSF